MLNEIVGEWVGDYSIWFEAGDPVSNSPSTLSAHPKPHGGVHVEYTWTLNGEAQSGNYDIAPNGNITLKDSFHTPNGAMECKATAPLDVLGSFEHEGETFGWHTKMHLTSADAFEITAWYVDKGAEQLATRASYRRA